MNKDDVELTLYLVGDTEEEARESLPFTDYPSAEGYADDSGGAKIWSVTATIDFTTMERFE